jgi:hypothetical protein
VDFFEQWFGISPDGGDGSLEVLWIVAIVLVLAVVVFRRQIANRLALRRTRRH